VERFVTGIMMGESHVRVEAPLQLPAA